ncbi:helix-turn-helix transcriptional regulator (plasmid) [Roseomonas marmotae]|uniref:Helix-turn-helix transcriptional regulator n=2 Tax=Roseomonas marmotae TaxID=2768161 RepID=A0ABS3KGR0_9PROT|nr:helix-turn-helix transcriptional regulator [Roseomonas marmotae]QTI81350.1 helix-turn-helix transcriptional regulator [Roseomonas marmotae]
MLINASQCRMARAAVGLTLRDLSRAAGISVNTLSRIESEGNVTSRTLAKVQQILMRHGAVFRRDGSVGVARDALAGGGASSRPSLAGG